jgi:ribosomal protein S27E
MSKDGLIGFYPIRLKCPDCGNLQWVNGYGVALRQDKCDECGSILKQIPLHTHKGKKK